MMTAPRAVRAQAGAVDKTRLSCRSWTDSYVLDRHRLLTNFLVFVLVCIPALLHHLRLSVLGPPWWRARLGLA